jgi:putative ABC transport system permease protein
MVMSKENVKYSLKNIAHRRSRSLLTIFSIFIGITTIFIFISFGWGLYDYVDSFVSGGSTDKVTIQPKGIGAPGLDSTFALTESDLRAVKSSSGVYAAEGVYMGVVAVEKNDITKYVMFGSINPETNLIREVSNLKIEKGRWFNRGDTRKVVLGHNYLLDNKIFPKSLDLNQKITLNGEEFRIIGFCEAIGNPQDDSNIYLLDEAAKIISPSIRGYSMIVARVDVESMKITIENIENSLRNSRDVKKGDEDFYVASFEDLIKSYMSALNIIIGFVILIALISVLVSAVNTANTMITSVLERFREIGIIKAIGAKNSEIFNMFLFESGFLGFAAGVVGVFFGWIITYAIKLVLENLGWGFLSPHYSYSLFIGCILFATITGAISGVLPAIRASKINVVQALRYE